MRSCRASWSQGNSLWETNPEESKKRNKIIEGKAIEPQQETHRVSDGERVALVTGGLYNV